MLIGHFDMAMMRQGMGIKAGRDNALPNDWLNCLLLTGCGAVAFIAPEIS